MRVTLDVALQRHMAAATSRARAVLGKRAAVSCVLQVLGDDVLRVIYLVGLDEGGRFVQKGMGECWKDAIESARERLASGG